MGNQTAKVEKRSSASREDWLRATFDVLRERGIEGVKVTVIAQRLGLTSGSFYWHFRNIQDLLDGILVYWEETLTGDIIEQARKFEGSPKDRIRLLMHQVIREDAALPDGAIAVWAKSDAGAATCYKRAMERRFEFAAWLFSEMGFDPKDAEIRGRMMVMALMGETTNGLRQRDDWEDVLDRHWRFLTDR
ncbi:MAG: TetR/AcrR family transcriptional regulator [Pseudomonadota bacterium]